MKGSDAIGLGIVQKLIFLCFICQNSVVRQAQSFSSWKGSRDYQHRSIFFFMRVGVEKIYAFSK